MRRILSALPLAGLFLVNSASAVTVVSTYPAWDGYNFAHAFGNAGMATGTYGQTFVAAEEYLLSYTSSFAYKSGNAFNFRLYIAPWSDPASKVTAAPLFTSPDLVSAAAADGYKSYTVALNLRLTPGEKYVAFYSTTDTIGSPLGSMKMAIANTDAYSDGTFRYNTASTLADVVTNTWSPESTFTDTAFSASFAAAPVDTVPEPASLLALGAGAVALVRRRRAR